MESKSNSKMESKTQTAPLMSETDVRSMLSILLAKNPNLFKDFPHLKILSNLFKVPEKKTEINGIIKKAVKSFDKSLFQQTNEK